MDKSLALSLVIGGVVGASLRAAVGATIAQVGRVGQAVMDAERQKAVALKETARLEQAGRQIDKYREIEKQVVAAGKAYEQAKIKVRDLGREIAASGKASAEQKQAYEAARKIVAAQDVRLRQLTAMRERMAAAGIDTRNLAEAERKLAAEMAVAKAKIDETTQAIKRQEEVMARVERRKELAGELRGQAMKVGAVALGPIDIQDSPSDVSVIHKVPPS